MPVRARSPYLGLDLRSPRLLLRPDAGMVFLRLVRTARSIFRPAATESIRKKQLPREQREAGGRRQEGGRKEARKERAGRKASHPHRSAMSTSLLNVGTETLPGCTRVFIWLSVSQNCRRS
eukprot:scaffold8272_cov248-Pinguiococcus_pyrenoidosus.AAC.11